MIYELVDGLPLALSQVAAYVEENAIDLGDYLALFQAHPSSLLRRGSELSRGDYLTRSQPPGHSPLRKSNRQCCRG